MTEIEHFSDKAQDEERISEERKNSLDALKNIFIEEQDINFLDLGQHNNTWYYGIALKGKNNLIVTSERIIYRTFVTYIYPDGMDYKEESRRQKVKEDEISKKFGLHYKHNLGSIAPFWRKEGAYGFEAFIKEELKPIDKQQLIQEIINELNHFMDFAEDNIYALIEALYILCSYCYILFDSLGILYINAPRGSGKTKNAKLLRFIAFRGYDMGASGGMTKAQLSRTLEGNKGLIIIDEYEFMDKESKQLTDQILNASIERDAYIITSEQVGKTWEPKKFHIFSPKVVCNITGLNPTTLTRCIQIKLIKAQKNSEKGKRRPKEYEFLELRDKLHCFFMQNWKKIKDIYETYEFSLSNREADVWKPLCAMSKFFGESYEKELLAFLEKYQKDKDYGDDYLTTLLLKIYENSPDIAEWFSSNHILENFKLSETEYEFKTHTIGRKLTEFKTIPKRKYSGINQFQLSKKIIKEVLERYYPNLLEKDNENPFSNTP